MQKFGDGLNGPGTVRVDGEWYQIVDIGMRMLQPHELAAAQGFTSDYILDVDIEGNSVTKTAQVAGIGNSVSPVIPEAMAIKDVKINMAFTLSAIVFAFVCIFLTLFANSLPVLAFMVLSLMISVIAIKNILCNLGAIASIDIYEGYVARQPTDGDLLRAGRFGVVMGATAFLLAALLISSMIWEEKEIINMSHEVQQLIAFIVLMLPVIFVHFAMKSAEKKMIVKGSEPPSNPMLPENDYGKGQQEAEAFENLRSARNVLFIPNILVAIFVVFFTSIFPL